MNKSALLQRCEIETGSKPSLAIGLESQSYLFCIGNQSPGLASLQEYGKYNGFEQSVLRCKPDDATVLLSEILSSAAITGVTIAILHYGREGFHARCSPKRCRTVKTTWDILDGLLSEKNFIRLFSCGRDPAGVEDVLSGCDSCLV